MTKGVNVRTLILEALQEILENGQMSHQTLNGVLEKYQYLEKQERAFISRSVEGVLEYLLRLDYILDSFSKTPVKKMKPFIRNLLRMSLYHLFYMDSVPERAVVSEAVKLAEKKGFSGLKGFVNGLLRNIIRNQEEIVWPKEELRRLEVQYSVPIWIIEEWKAVCKKDEIELLLQSLHEESSLHVRVNRKKLSPKECRARLIEEGVTAEFHPYLPECLKISGFDYLGKLKAFQEGLFQVQDVSSMLAGALGVSYLEEKPQGMVMDVCSAPGGKALYVAEHCPQVEILARDISDYKLSLVEENKKRSGVTNLRTEQFDAEVLDETHLGKADVVLADLPCSGLGILKKKRDIAYKTKKEDIGQLAGLQRRILANAAEYVKTGGILIYSTCTITEAENLENLEWFLATYDFERENISAVLPRQFQEETMEKGYLQLRMGVQESDGFFLSAVRKK